MSGSVPAPASIDLGWPTAAPRRPPFLRGHGGTDQPRRRTWRGRDDLSARAGGVRPRLRLPLRLDSRPVLRRPGGRAGRGVARTDGRGSQLRHRATAGGRPLTFVLSGSRYCRPAAASAALSLASALAPSRWGLWKPNDEAAKESNLPSDGLHRPAGFEDQMGHQTPAAPRRSAAYVPAPLRRRWRSPSRRSTMAPSRCSSSACAYLRLSPSASRTSAMLVEPVAAATAVTRSRRRS